MYDIITRSLIFGARNTDKVVNSSDKGRIAADVGQYAKALRKAAELDDKVGKGSRAAIGAMKKVTNTSKALKVAEKAAKFASDNVNPLLIGAAGYRVAISKDKPKALRREVIGMSTMFGGEALIKEVFESKAFKTFKNGIKNKYLKAAIGIAEGIAFVGVSILSSTAGYKLSDAFYGKIDEQNDSKTANTVEDKLKKETQKLEAVKAELNKNNKVFQKISADTQKPLVA